MVTKSQYGGSFIGFVMGLVVGLGVSLAVAIYVTKVPTPFSNKNQPRSSEQDSAESQKNKDWNPNNIFQPKAPAEVPASPGDDMASKQVTPPSGTKPSIETVKPEPAKAENRPAVTADPLGDLAKAKAGGGDEPFVYFVQLGAYRTMEDAESQRAKLSLGGVEAKVSERADKGYATQVYLRMTLGGSRTQLGKVLRVNCDDQI